MSLKGLQLEKFKHSKGAHCESTTVRECINYLGFEYSEPVIFGLDASMGFSYWGIEEVLKSDQSALESFVIGGKQGFFTENSLACRLLGLTVEKRTFQRSTEAWKDVEQCLAKNLPLVLQVDMGFLPYFKDMGDFHFGGHFVSLIGYDQKTATASITDNDFDEIKTVPTSAIDQARGSTFGPKFMHPGNVRYVIQQRADGKKPPVSGALKMAIQQVVKQMRWPSISQMGLAGLKRFMESIESWPELFQKTPERASHNLHSMYGYIEEYGTGGSLFRKLYLDYLEEVIQWPELRQGKTAWTENDFKIVNDAIPIERQLVELWHKFAQALKTAVDKNKDHAIDYLDYEFMQLTIKEIYQLEDSFFSKLQNIKL